MPTTVAIAIVVGTTRRFAYGGPCEFPVETYESTGARCGSSTALCNASRSCLVRDLPARSSLPPVLFACAGLAEPLHEVQVLVLAYQALTNGAVAFIQILLGPRLPSRRFTRAALAASIAWAPSVWIVGERVGRITAGATPLTGAPAVLLYAVIALLTWTKRERQENDRPSWLALPAWCT